MEKILNKLSENVCIGAGNCDIIPVSKIVKGECIMKLIFAVVHDDDTNKAVRRLNEKKFRVTKLSSSGGFLKRGNTTLMLGVEDEQVDEVFKILEKECSKRKQVEVTTPYPQGDLSMISYSYIPITVEVGGATVFVLDVEQFRRI